MTNEEIRRLVMEATAKVTNATPQPPPVPSPQPEVRRVGTLVLLPPYTVFPREAFLQRFIGTGQVILAGFGVRSSTNFPYWNLETSDGVSRLLDSLESFGAIYLYAPGFSMMAQLAAREDTDPLARILLQRLLSGKEAGICFEHDPVSLPPGLKTHLEAAIAPLKSLGFSILCVSCGGAPIQGIAETAAKSKDGSKTVLLEEDILTLHQQGRTSLQVGAGAILTPLAADKARELGIEIEG